MATLTAAQIAANKARNTAANATFTAPTNVVKTPTVIPQTSVTKNTSTVSEQDYARAVAAATPSAKQINEASAAGVNPVTGTSINSTQNKPKTAIAPAQAGAPVGMTDAARNKQSAQAEIDKKNAAAAPAPITATKENLGKTVVGADGRTRTVVESSVTPGTYYLSDQKADQANMSQYEAWKAVNPEKSYQEWQTEIGGGLKAAASSKQARTDAEKAAGDKPVGEQPPEDHEETPEERAQRLQRNAEALQAWWEKVASKSQADVGTATAMAADMKTQMESYGASIEELRNQLNTAKPGMGDAMNEAITQAAAGDSGNLSPAVLAKIEELGQQNLTPEEFKAQVTALISSNANPSALAQAGITDNGTHYTMPSGISFPKIAGSTGLDYTQIPKDASAWDMLAMENALGNKIAENSYLNDVDNLKNLTESTRRAKETAMAEIANNYTEGINDTVLEQLKVENEIKYTKQKMSNEKDSSLANIMNNKAEMEGFLKGQLEAWGADSSSAGLTVLSKTNAKFLAQYTETALGYDTELARLNDKQTEASMAYTNSILKLVNDKQNATDKVTDMVFDNIDKIYSGYSAANRDKESKLMLSSKDYFTNARALKAKEEEVQREIQKNTQDFNMDLMQEYAQQQGFVYELNKNGEVQMKLDENGFPIPTLAARSLEAKNQTIDYSGGGAAAGTAGGSGAQPLQITMDYLNGVDPNYLKSVGNGNIISGSPWANGIDIDGNVGDPIKSPSGGTVVRVQDKEQPGSGKGFGNNVLIRTDDGKLIQFSHLSTANVKEGDKISAGQTLGAMGNTGFVLDINGNKPTAQQLKSGIGSHVDITMWDSIQQAEQSKEQAMSSQATADRSAADTKKASDLDSHIKSTVKSFLSQGIPEDTIRNIMGVYSDRYDLSDLNNIQKIGGETQQKQQFRPIANQPELNSMVNSILDGKRTIDDYNKSDQKQIMAVFDAQNLSFENNSGSLSTKEQSVFDKIKVADLKISSAMESAEGDQEAIDLIKEDIRNQLNSSVEGRAILGKYGEQAIEKYLSLLQ